MKKLYYTICLSMSLVLLNGCGPYSFTGADTGAAKTFQVNFFPNNAQLIEPGIDILFTNSLQDLIQNQTNLSLVNSGGDLTYEGEITEYRSSPMTATADQRAAQNRLTISVNVRYFNRLDEEKDFERRFSFFFDYPANQQLVGTTKDVAIETIYERLTLDIFNASLANW
jgi:hypothetical protein